MKENFEKIIESYQKEVKGYNEKAKREKITNYGEAINAMFDAINMLSIQNDIIIRLLVNERLERENGKSKLGI